MLSQSEFGLSHRKFGLSHRTFRLLERKFVLSQSKFGLSLESKFVLPFFGGKNRPRLCTLLISKEYVIFNPMTLNSFQFLF